MSSGTYDRFLRSFSRQFYLLWEFLPHIFWEEGERNIFFYNFVIWFRDWTKDSRLIVYVAYVNSKTLILYSNFFLSKYSWNFRDNSKHLSGIFLFTTIHILLFRCFNKFYLTTIFFFTTTIYYSHCICKNIFFLSHNDPRHPVFNVLSFH